MRNFERDETVEERWADYQAAHARAMEMLKADPANRHAEFKAWCWYLLKMVGFTAFNSVLVFIALWLSYPEAWSQDSIATLILAGSMAVLAGTTIYGVTFPPPMFYWEKRANEVVDKAEIPRRHKSF